MCVSFQLLQVYRPPTPFCFKLCFTPVNFYKRPPLVSAFSNWKTLGEELLFWEKVKSKVLSMCLAASCRAGSGHPGSERGRPAGSAPPRLTVRPPRLGTVWTSGLDLCLFCASESRTCPKLINCSSCSISVHERFPRNTLLQDSKRTLCIQERVIRVVWWVIVWSYGIIILCLTTKLLHSG